MLCVCKWCAYKWQSRVKKPLACPSCKRYQNAKKRGKANATSK